MEQTLDITAFNALFAEYQGRFIRFATGYISNKAAAEDIVMESFSAAWKNRERLTPSGFAPYVLTAIRNKCLNYLRDEKLHTHLLDDFNTHQMRKLNNCIMTLEACDPKEIFSEDTRRIIEKTLERVPKRTLEIFLRSRDEGQTYREIASAMGLTVKSVEFEIAKVIRMMRLELRDYLSALLLFIYFY